jgi:hypothetical protein
MELLRIFRHFSIFACFKISILYRSLHAVQSIIILTAYLTALLSIRTVFIAIFFYFKLKGSDLIA